MALTRADLEGNAEERLTHEVDDTNTPLPQPEEFNSRLERAINMNKKNPTAQPSPNSPEARTQAYARRFPWVLKNWKRKQVMYDWDQGFINETIDPYYAARWYEQNKINKREVKEQFFGDFEVFTLFMLNPQLNLDPAILPRNITKDFAEFLWLLTSQRILKEKNFRVWQTLLQIYDLYEVENPDPIPNIHFFKRKNDVARTTTSSLYEQSLSKHPLDTWKITDPTILQTGDERLINFLKDKAPALYKLYQKAIAIPSDSSKHNLDLKLATFEKIIKKFNEQFSDPASRKDNAAPLYSLQADRPTPDDREHQPLREAANFPAIQNMSIIEVQELCAMKDFLEWRIKFKPSILKWKVIEQPYSNTTLTTQFNNEPTSPTYHEPITIYWHYTSSVRYAMFWQEKYYKRIRPWQTLQPWQWIAKLYKGWVTTVVAPRRWWKSYWAIDEAVEMFTADTQERSRPIRVLFVGINTKKLKTVIKYLLSFTKEFAQAWYFDWEASKNIMHYRKKESNKKATEADDLWTIEFIWSKDEDAWVWDYADLIIIDECERIDENVWEDILPIITNEWARCILISTLNKNSQKTWFYQQLIQGETEELQRNLTQQDVVTVIREKRNKRVQPAIDKATLIQQQTWQPVPFEEWINWIDIDAMSSDMRIARQRVWLRFTGEDTDLKTDQEKSFARDRLRWTKAYYPEWWAIFPEDTWVYDYESSIKDSSYFQWRQYKFVVVAYDPAESKDKAALVYMWYDDIANKIELFKTEKLPNNYTYHWPFIDRTLIECQQRIDPSSLPDNIWPDQRVFFAYDFNWVGQGLEPFFVECWVRIDLKVRFTGQGWITKKWINHNVPKELLVNMLQNTMDHWALIINQECQEFIEELDHYKSYYNPDTWNTKYQAEHWATDDFVSAAMIGTYFILEYMWEKFNITKNEIEQAIDPDNDFSVEDMFKEVERIVMEGVNNWKTVQQVIDEYNGRSQRNSLKRQDVLSQFWY